MTGIQLVEADLGSFSTSGLKPVIPLCLLHAPPIEPIHFTFRQFAVPVLLIFVFHELLSRLEVAQYPLVS